MKSAIVVGVDPGKLGFECALGPCRLCEKGFPLADGSPVHYGTQRLGMIPETPCSPAAEFWPAPLVEVQGHPQEGDYHIPRMSDLCQGWFDRGVHLVALEQQAPQRRGSGKFGMGREGTISSWTNGYGFGAWEACLVAAGFARSSEEEVRDNGGHWSPFPSIYVVVDPLAWKRRMGAVAHHRGEDARGARKRANDLRTIEVAKRLDPSIDFRAIERGGGVKRADSPDKAAAYCLARYARDWILGGKQDDG